MGENAIPHPYRTSHPITNCAQEPPAMPMHVISDVIASLLLHFIFLQISIQQTLVSNSDNDPRHPPNTVYVINIMNELSFTVMNIPTPKIPTIAQMLNSNSLVGHLSLI